MAAPPSPLQRASSSAATDGIDSHSVELGDDSSDEDSSPELPPSILSHPTAASVVILVERAQRMQDKAAKLACKNDGRVADAQAVKNQMDSFDEDCQSHIKEVLMCHGVLRARIDAMEAESSDLVSRKAQQRIEQAQLESLIAEGEGQGQDHTERIQRLMDRLVTLLSANNQEEEAKSSLHFDEAIEDLRRSVVRLELQTNSQRSQLGTAQLENRRVALQLSDEQQRTKKLHDTLCHFQKELFNGRTRSNGRRNSTRRPSHHASQHALPPALEDKLGVRSGSTGARADDNARPCDPVDDELEHYQNVEHSLQARYDEQQRDFDLEQQELLFSQSVPLDQLRPLPVDSAHFRAAPSAAVADRELVPRIDLHRDSRSGSAPDAGAGPHMEWDREEFTAGMPAAVSSYSAYSTSSVGAEQTPEPSSLAVDELSASAPMPSGGASKPTEPSFSSIDKLLCKALEDAQFESLVVRLGHNHYQFGKSVRANVRLQGNDIYASVDGQEWTLLSHFIARISSSNKVPQAPTPPAPVPATPAEAMGSTMMDPTWTAGQAARAGTPGAPEKGYPVGMGIAHAPRLASPRQLRAGDDAAGLGRVAGVEVVSQTSSKKSLNREPPRSPPPQSRISANAAAAHGAHGATNLAGSRQRLDKKTIAGTMPAARRSPVRQSAVSQCRSPSPDDGGGLNTSKASLGVSVPSVNLSGMVLVNQGSGNYGSGNYAPGSANYGSGNYAPGSGSYSHDGGSCKVTPGNVSPNRGYVAGTSPPRSATPRQPAQAAPRAGTPRGLPQWRQQQQHPQACMVPTGGVVTMGPTTPRAHQAVVTAPAPSSFSQSSWPSPPRNSVLTRNAASPVGRPANGPPVTKPWQFIPASTVGGSPAMHHQTSSPSPTRKAVMSRPCVRKV